MSEIDHVMERVGRIVAADQALTVHVRGISAFAIPGEVTIPSIEHYSYLGQNAERMLHGLLDHECGHASDTDFSVSERAAHRGAAFKELWNAIEDGYIEGRKGLQFVGCQHNLSLKNRWFWELVNYKGETVQTRIANPPDLWTGFVLAVGIVVRPYGGRSIDEFRFINEDVFRMLDMVRGELGEVGKLLTKAKASKDTYEIAERIFKRFERESESAEHEDEDTREGRGDVPQDGDDVQPPGDDRPSDQEGEDSQEATRSGRGVDEEDGQETGSDDDDGVDDQDPHDRGREKDEGELKRRPRDMELERWTRPHIEFNPEQAIDLRLRAMFDQSAHTRPYIVFSHEWDVERDFSSEDLSPWTSAFDACVREVRETSSALTSAFEAALRAKRESRPIPGADEGQVDPTMLGEFAVGAAPADQIYMQYAAEDDIDVAVSVLVDCSGSMSGYRKAWLAKRCAIAINQALSSCQIPHEICGFSTLISHLRHDWCAAEDRAKYVRSFAEMRAALSEAERRGVDVRKFARSVYGAGYREVVRVSDTELQVPFYGIFKSFTSDDARGLCWVKGAANNLDGEAVLWQARRLALRPEKRRIMFVLSDGLPAGSNDNLQGARYLKQAVQRILDAGIEVYGLGMVSDAVRQFYPIHWVCHTMEDLTKLAFGSMTEIIIERRHEQEWVGRI